MPVTARRWFATATGPHIVHPPSFGPVIHRDATAVPGALAGDDAFLLPPDDATRFAFPMLVVLVTVVPDPDRVVVTDRVMPVRLLIVLVTVVLCGALAITGSPPFGSGDGFAHLNPLESHVK